MIFLNPYGIASLLYFPPADNPRWTLAGRGEKEKVNQGRGCLVPNRWPIVASHKFSDTVPAAVARTLEVCISKIAFLIFRKKVPSLTPGK